MKINIVTYLDANYLGKWLVCYKSLKKNFSDEFTMYVYCFDNITYEILKFYKFSNVIPVHKKDFEIPEILSQKGSKKSYEYFWTYTPTVLLHTMEKVPDNDLVVYMDSDMMFFNSPQCIFDELEDKDVLLQPNNFSVNERWQFDPIGYYCTSFNVFRNNANTKKIVNEWKLNCINLCDNDFKKGQFGDQKYLDYWRNQYKRIREITVIGANIAPWNIQKFDVNMRENRVFVNNNPLIYYHFHAFKMNLQNYSYMIEGDRNNHYDIASEVIEYIYKPYIKESEIAIKQLKKHSHFRDYVKKNPQGNVGWYGNE